MVEEEGEEEEKEDRMEALEMWKVAGMVPVPVAVNTACSAWRSSHCTVSPSDLWPSSRVSWKIRAAQAAGMRMRRPRPSTLVWRSLVELRLGGGAGAAAGGGAAAAAGADWLWLYHQ